MGLVVSGLRNEKIAKELAHQRRDGQDSPAHIYEKLHLDGRMALLRYGSGQRAGLTLPGRGYSTHSRLGVVAFLKKDLSPRPSLSCAPAPVPVSVLYRKI